MDKHKMTGGNDKDDDENPTVSFPNPSIINSTHS